VQLLPGHARAHNNLGSVLHMQGKLEARWSPIAGRWNWTRPAPGETELRIDRARRGTLARAAEDYRRHTQANPNDAHAFNDLGNTLRELGRHDEALAA
jgi:tetratricopeptide (TPR) repeat protein